MLDQGLHIRKDVWLWRSATTGSTTFLRPLRIPRLPHNLRIVQYTTSSWTSIKPKHEQGNGEEVERNDGCTVRSAGWHTDSQHAYALARSGLV